MTDWLWGFIGGVLIGILIGLLLAGLIIMIAAKKEGGE